VAGQVATNDQIRRIQGLVRLKRLACLRGRPATADDFDKSFLGIAKTGRGIVSHCVIVLAA
jgi:hypothetical protein